MFKELLSGASKFFTQQRIILLAVFIVLVWALITYSGSKSFVLDGMETGTPSNAVSAPVAPAPPVGPAVPSNAVPTMSSTVPSDLLPANNNEWAGLNPVNQGNIMAPDLLQAGYHIGLNSIGQSNRNANLQLRSDPVIPVQQVGPWMNHTMEPDYGRIPLEIGATA